MTAGNTFSDPLEISPLVPSQRTTNYVGLDSRYLFLRNEQKEKDYSRKV
jgi:hypothetical protein